MNATAWAWQDAGVCRHPRAQANADFFPGDRRSRGAVLAKAYCGVCPIRQQCLDYALRNAERGIWGGLDDVERDDIRMDIEVRTA